MKNQRKNAPSDTGTETPEQKAKTRKAPKAKSASKKRILPAWLKDERTQRITGIAFIFVALFFLIGSLSFLFTGEHDLRLIYPSDNADDTRETYRNTLGLLGAHAGYLLTHRWFGLGSLFIPFLVFLYGVRIGFQKSLLPLAKTTRLSLVGMLYTPLLIGFLFHEGQIEDGLTLTCNDNLVGYGGQFLLEQSIYTLGGFGTFLLLLFAAGTAVIFNFNALLNRLNLPSKVLAFFERPNRADASSTPHDSSNTDEAESAEQTDTELRNKPKEQDLPPSFPKSDDDPTDAILNEMIGQPSETASPPFDVDSPDEKVAEENAATVDLTEEVTDSPPASKSPAQPESSEDSELEIEYKDDEDELSEDEIDDKVQEFGVYDPKLDLSRYELPNIDLLEAHGSGAVEINKEELEVNKNRIVETLNNYNIEISKIKATVGPTVTLYEIIPAPGVRISKIKNLEDDIALSLAALGIRIIAPIPGKGTIGIEVPNSNPNIVAMRSLIASDKFQNSDMELPVAIGKTISNETFTFDLAKMPHLLMAGATGQGKSVGLNAILVSLLYKKHPAQLKFVLVDPKKVELTLFNKIERHFLAKLPDEEEPIITDTSKVVTTLNSLCVEMDDRYELLKVAHCRNIKEYNKKFIQRKLNPDNGHRYLPYIVLVVDEFADLIMTAGKEVETPIARLAQLARAIGIHLIIATQRPSVNIITGTIKANFPARIAFRVTSKIDSRTILDAGGADQLIGRGDMLFSTGSDLTRIQCGFVDTPEVEQITEFIGSQQGYPDAHLLPEYKDESSSDIGGISDDDRDELFEEAARIIVMHQQGSTSLLQRKLKLGYNRAGRLVDQLEAAGIIGPFEGSKARKVLIPDEISLEQLLQRSE